MGGLLLALCCGSSVTAAAGDTWEGTWERTELPGKHLFLTQTGSQVSGHYDWNDATGTVLEGKVSGATLSASFRETRYEGSFTLTLTGKAFSGRYTGKNKETGGPIEGPFNGTCVAGACRANGASAPSAPAAVTPTSTPPALGKTTLYEAPPAGNTAGNPLPKVTKKSRELEGSIGFVDNQGKPVAGPSIAAVYAQAEAAAKLCAVLNFAPGGDIVKEDEKELVAPVPSYAACVDAVARVLARNDEIQKAKAARAKAAASVCATLVAGKGKRHSPLRVSCKPTATGLKLVIRPRSSRQTLAGAFHGHSPKLIVGRSAVAPGPVGLRTSEFWRAK